MKHFVHLVIAALLTLGAVSPAQAAETISRAVFVTIDSVEVIGERNLEIGGILDGEAEVRTFQFNFSDSATSALCHKQALLATERPGRYALEVGHRGGINRFTCKLVRR